MTIDEHAKQLGQVLESELTDEQYQEIGFKLMARLGAIYKTKKRIKSDD